jgi:integrase
MKREASSMKAVPGEKGIFQRGKKYVAIAYAFGIQEPVGTFATVAEARRARLLKIAQMHQDDARGRPLKYDKETTFATWATDWLERRGTPTNSNAYEASTLRAVRTHLVRHLLPIFGAYRLQKLTPTVVEQLFEKIAVGRSNKYRRSIFQTLGMILGDASLKRVIPFDPTEHLPLPKVRQRRVEVLAPDIVRRVIETMAPPWRDAALLAVSTGLREGELLALQWSDIDLEKKRIRVNKARDQAGAEKAPKTSESVRYVALNDDTIATLLSYRERMRAERAAALRQAEATLQMELARRPYARNLPEKAPKHRRPRPGRVRGESVRAYKARMAIEQLRSLHWDVYVFAARVMPKRKETRMPVLDPRNLLRELQRAARVVGVKLRFHDLRHVFASVVLQLGGDSALKFVQKNLGHARASFTLDLYAHILPERSDAFLAPIGALFHAPAPNIAPNTEGGDAEPRDGSAVTSGDPPTGPRERS